MVKQHWKPLNLPASLVDELKDWRKAFIAASREELTYADILRSMISNLPKTNPEVVEEYKKIVDTKTV